MKFFRGLSLREIGFPQLALSLLIIGLGWLGGQELSKVDQDLRVMYTEYTLGATDLAHVMADVMRYRSTVVRALEADNKKEFDRITGACLSFARKSNIRSIDTPLPAFGSPEAAGASRRIFRRSVSAWMITSTARGRPQTSCSWSGPPPLRRRRCSFDGRPKCTPRKTPGRRSFRSASP